MKHLPLNEQKLHLVLSFKSEQYYFKCKPNLYLVLDFLLHICLPLFSFHFLIKIKAAYSVILALINILFVTDSDHIIINIVYFRANQVYFKDCTIILHA